ncbi:MAG: nucleoside transporter C-terminal domain-containing protein, partial [Candidatus Hydrogenedentota bacterium]
LGTKTVVNEFLAYESMGSMLEAGKLSPRSITILTYALCGFANPGSLGILIGGLSGLVPERRGEIAALGLKSLIAGTLAVFMTACIAGILG